MTEGGVPPATFLGDDGRDRLIVAAVTICAERGYDEMSEGEIAARAGLPGHAMEEHFPGGRADCLAAAQNAILLEVVKAVSDSYSADRSEWDSVIYGVKAILDLMAANPLFAYLGYIFSRQMAPGQVKESNETGHRMLAAMLERGWDYSDSALQPACTAMGVLGGAEAVVRREVARGRAERLPQLLPDLVYIATVPFLGQQEALRLARRSEELFDPT